ncbi:sensor histidine kinase [Paenibacillus sacheonensis]|uniref:histidine kinase n=1 Tax=Paenibacillus sacheonensis TaxID=742054 RepID=A0A7X5BV39_9BACL|nr:sensor histidine kinase [Paenibacillus sacheonensis]MBM7563432.1 sensor histidine kinase YesM [Paenibacillus sacheonensis]NBC68013.1 HAMP domain-containing protein [Paenibacillus sacheonensis]
MKTIRSKMMMLSIIIWIIMAFIWISMSIFNQRTVEKYNDILQRYLLMNQASELSRQALTTLNTYRMSPTEDNLRKYVEDGNRLLRMKMDMNLLRNPNNEMQLVDFQHMVDSQSQAMNLAVRFQRDHDDEAVAEQFDEASNISGYISEAALSLIGSEQHTYDNFYRQIIERSNEIKKMGFWTLAFVSLLLLLFSYRFVNSVTRPILKLTQSARELSRGNFQKPIVISNNDDMSFLAKTLDNMRLSIGSLFDEVQSKAQLEYDLHKHKLMLKESELKSLQSQINPHFLFNTLNMLSKEAYLAGADKTSELISSVAGMLRYNLRRMDSRVSLRDEINVVEEYLTIQQARFGSRVIVVREIDEAALDLEVPILILQPLVENAFIYAIEPSEDGGVLTLRVVNGDEYVRVQVMDDGPGMTSEKLAGLMSDAESADYKGHSTGLGIRNVRDRLQLFYGEEDLIAIDAPIGEGTSITIKLPRRPNT